MLQHQTRSDCFAGSSCETFSVMGNDSIATWSSTVTDAVSMYIPIQFLQIYNIDIAETNNNNNNNINESNQIIIIKSIQLLSHHGVASDWKLSSSAIAWVNSYLQCNALLTKAHANSVEKATSDDDDATRHIQRQSNMLKSFIDVSSMASLRLHNIQRSSSHHEAVSALRILRKQICLMENICFDNDNNNNNTLRADITRNSDWLGSLRRFIDMCPLSEADDMVLTEVLSLMRALLPSCKEKDMLTILLLTKSNLIQLLDVKEFINNRNGSSSTSNGDGSVHSKPIRDMLAGASYNPNYNSGVSYPSVPRRSLRLSILQLITTLLQLNWNNDEAALTLTEETQLIRILHTQYISTNCIEDVALRRQAICVSSALLSNLHSKLRCVHMVGHTGVIVPSLLSVCRRHRFPDSFSGKSILRSATIALRNMISLTYSQSDGDDNINTMKSLLWKHTHSSNQPSNGDEKVHIEGETNQNNGMLLSDLTWLKSLIMDREVCIRHIGLELFSFIIDHPAPNVSITLLQDHVVKVATDPREVPFIRSAALNVLSSYFVLKDTGYFDGMNNIESKSKELESPLLCLESICQISGSTGNHFIQQCSSSPSLASSFSLLLRNLYILDGINVKSFLFGNNLWKRLLHTSITPGAMKEQYVQRVCHINDWLCSNNSNNNSNNYFQGRSKKSSVTDTTSNSDVICESMWNDTSRYLYEATVINYLNSIMNLLHSDVSFIHQLHSINLPNILMEIIANDSMRTTTGWISVYNTLSNLLLTTFNSTRSSGTSGVDGDNKSMHYDWITEMDIQKVFASMSQHVTVNPPSFFNTTRPSTLRQHLSVARFIMTLFQSSSKWFDFNNLLHLPRYSNDGVGALMDATSSVANITKSIYFLFQQLMKPDCLMSNPKKIYGNKENKITFGDAPACYDAALTIGNTLCVLLKSSSESKEALLNMGGLRFLLNMLQTKRSEVLFHNQSIDFTSTEATPLEMKSHGLSRVLGEISLILKILKSLLLHSKLARDSALTCRLTKELHSLWNVFSVTKYYVILTDIIGVLMNLTENNNEGSDSLLFTAVQASRLSELGRKGDSLLHSIVNYLMKHLNYDSNISLSLMHTHNVDAVTHCLDLMQTVVFSPVVRGVLCKLDFFAQICGKLQMLLHVKRSKSKKSLLYGAVNTYKQQILNVVANATFSDDGSAAVSKVCYFLELVSELLNTPSQLDAIYAPCCLIIRNFAFSREYKSKMMSTPNLIQGVLKVVSLTQKSIEAKLYSASCLWAFLFNYQKAIAAIKKLNVSDAIKEELVRLEAEENKMKLKFEQTSSDLSSNRNTPWGNTSTSTTSNSYQGRINNENDNELMSMLNQTKIALAACETIVSNWKSSNNISPPPSVEEAEFAVKQRNIRLKTHHTRFIRGKVNSTTHTCS